MVAIRDRTAADAAAFRSGRLDPTRLYVVLSGPVPEAVRSRVEIVDGVAVVPPTAMEHEGLLKSPS